MCHRVQHCSVAEKAFSKAFVHLNEHSIGRNFKILKLTRKCPGHKKLTT